MQVPGAVGEKEKIKKVWKTVAYFPDPWVGSGSPGDFVLFLRTLTILRLFSL
jgi:hypothetical protein